MKKENILLFFMVTLLSIGCDVSANPTPLLIENPILSIQPTLTTLPTVIQESSTPVLTLAPSLKTSGPYFSYLREVDGIQQIVMMDADGVGRKVISLPEEISDYLIQGRVDMRYLSPNGRWFAFYTGYAGELFSQQSESKKFDLSLNLLDLTTGETQIITPLLSKNYPDNFSEAGKQINNPNIDALMLQSAFLYGIKQSIAWSPDGRYLAFAGQMEGLSSDLYVYEMETQIIRRLSSGDQEIQWISWSPDGKWIVHGSVYEVGAGMIYDIYAARADGISVHHLSKASIYNGIEKWLNGHTYFENDNENGLGSYGLRLVNVDTGRIVKLWEGSYLSYEVNEVNKKIVINALLPDMLPELNATPDLAPGFVPGPYLIDLITLKKNKIHFPFTSNEIFLDHSIIPFDLNENIFVLMGNSSNSYFLSKNAQLTPLDMKNVKISVSPDSKYWVAVTGKDVNIYSVSNILVNSLPLSLLNMNSSKISWRPDSSGLFLIDDTLIYSINILNGESKLVENKLTNDFGNSDPMYKWISGQ